MAHAPGKYPVVMTFGPYGKDLHFSDHRLESWETLVNDYPDIFEGSVVIERKTAEIETAAWAEIARIEAQGGAIAAVARFFQMYRDEADKLGYQASPDQLAWSNTVYVADTDEKAMREAGDRTTWAEPGARGPRPGSGCSGVRASACCQGSDRAGV